MNSHDGDQPDGGDGKRVARRGRRRVLSDRPVADPSADHRADPSADHGTDHRGGTLPMELEERPAGALPRDRGRSGVPLPRAPQAPPALENPRHASPTQLSAGEPPAAGGLPPMPPLQPELPPFPVPADGASARWIKVALVTLGCVLAASVFALVTLVFGVEHVARDLPSVEKLKAGYDPPQITRILARDDTLLASLFTERRTVVPFTQIPDAAKLAFLAAEDASFYEHEGLDYFGMLRALWANFRAGRTVQGGSTITQQVVKNVLLDSERSYRRKIRETVLARRLEQSLSKDDIFWLYLNHIYLGHGRYGIEEAARYYFGKHASELSLDEAAVLAGLIAAPERYSPRRDAEKALSRKGYVLAQMLRKGFVTPELHATATARPLRLAPEEESESRLAPEAVERVRGSLRRVLGPRAVSGGYTARTTIDPALQAAARAAVRKNLDQYMKRHGLVAPFTAKKRALWGEPFSGQPQVNGIYAGVVEELDDRAGTIDVRVGDGVGRVTLSAESRYNPTHLPPSQFTQPGALLRVRVAEQAVEGGKLPLRLELGPQSALVAIDARSREILALVGSYEAVAGGLDRATQSRRQPGSTIKPVVYAYALHSRRFTPASMIPVDQKGNGVQETGNGSFISLRDALAHSNNQASVALLQQSGVEHVVQWARALGVESRLEPDLSLALGAYEMTPIELANVYATFASGGVYAETRLLAGAQAPDGRPVELPGSPPERSVMTPDEAYLSTSLMRSVITSGTGRRAAQLGFELAGKTGTTNDSKDAWFAGFSTELVAAVWVGYDDARSLGKSESGAVTALPAWIEFMKAAHEKRPKTAFRRPPGVLELEVDPETGLLPRPDQTERRREEFLAGTEPTEVAAYPDDAGAPETSESEGSDPHAPEPPPVPSEGEEAPEVPQEELEPEPPPF